MNFKNALIGTVLAIGLFVGPSTALLAATNSNQVVVQIEGVFSEPEFTGIGLNDLRVSGNYTLEAEARYEFVISTVDAAGSDKFKYRKNGGALSSEITITGVAQTLIDGLVVTFDSKRGHTLNDITRFKAIGSSGLVVKDSDGAAVLVVHNSGEAVQVVVSGAISATNLSGTNTGNVTLVADPNGLALTGQQLSLALADATHDGALSQTDWVIFNGKQDVLVAADATHDGYLDKDDFVIFAAKQNALVAGDITSSLILDGTIAGGDLASNIVILSTGALEGASLTATASASALPTCDASKAGQQRTYRKGADITEATSLCVCEEAAGAYGWVAASATGDCT